MTPPNDPFDELAELFLTEPDSAAIGTATLGRRVEMLVVGHLPVRADLWLSPYADAVARDDGPTCLIRLGSEDPTAQVFRGMPIDRSQPPRTIEGLASELARTVGVWIVRPAHDASPRELLEAGVDRFTVLTSVDELARVRAFERIKTLAETARRLELPLPTIAVAVIGASLQRAAEVQVRLQQTIDASALNVALASGPNVPRIESDIRSSDWLRLAADAAMPLRTLTRALDEATVDRSQPTEAVFPATDRDIPAEPDLPPAQPHTPAPAPDTTTPARLRFAPKAAVEVESKDHPPQEPDDGGRPALLSDHLLDVDAMAARCPGEERVELGVDASGRLHVLGRENDLRAIQKVAAWAARHRDLLALAVGDVWIDPRGDVVRHLFTDRPATVADLYETGLRLHVLAPVVVNGASGWYHAPLNDSV